MLSWVLPGVWGGAEFAERGEAGVGLGWGGVEVVWCRSGGEEGWVWVGVAVGWEGRSGVCGEGADKKTLDYDLLESRSQTNTLTCFTGIFSWVYPGRGGGSAMRTGMRVVA